MTNIMKQTNKQTNKKQKQKQKTLTFFSNGIKSCLQLSWRDNVIVKFKIKKNHIKWERHPKPNLSMFKFFCAIISIYNFLKNDIDPNFSHPKIQNDIIRFQKVMRFLSYWSTHTKNVLINNLRTARLS